MKPILPLFVFIDALGWEITRHRPFAREVAPHRRRLTSVFGYSSACVPSILSGGWPDEHRNWCYFVYDPAHSPFRSLRPLRWLPSAITSRRIFRRWLSKLVKVQLKFRGYFDLYNIPFRHISLFDFSEKKSPLQAGGMNRGANIVDFLRVRNIPGHISDPTRDELANLQALEADVQAEAIDFAFLYWPELDGLLHQVGNQSSAIAPKLEEYDHRIQRLLQLAREHYAEVRLYIFGDHGMANCTELLDLPAKIKALKLRFGIDYAVVYDSTMARFWFFNEPARQAVTKALAQVPEGRILPDAELKDLRTFFPDRYFGELIFLVREGVLIVPSHMGARPLTAMHGYHPDEPHSFAALMTNQSELPADVTAIPHMFNLMVRDAEEAHARNSRPGTIVDLTPPAAKDEPATAEKPTAVAVVTAG